MCGVEGVKEEEEEDGSSSSSAPVLRALRVRERIWFHAYLPRRCVPSPWLVPTRSEKQLQPFCRKNVPDLKGQENTGLIMEVSH